MNKLIIFNKKLFFAAVFFYVSAFNLFSGSLTLKGAVDNFTFDYYENDTPNTFRTPYYMPVGAAELAGEFTTYARYNLGFKIDPVIRYILFGEAVFNLWLFRLGAGTFISMFNKGDQEYVPGFSGSIGIELPGGLSFFVEYGLNAFTDLTIIGNTNLNFGSVNLSIWLPNVVTNFKVIRKSFTQVRGLAYTIRNTQFRYEAMLDIYAKTMPVIITAGGGFQNFEKSIEEIPGAGFSGIPRSMTIEMFFGKLAFDIEAGQNLHILIGGESGPPIKEGFYFSAFAGIKFVKAEW